MPWRLIVFVIILGFVVVFAGFNVNNVSDVSFGFRVAEDVPIFISLFFAFAVGVVIMLPFVVGRSKKQRLPKPKSEPLIPETTEDPPSDGG
jgi:uncharacterized integral membrane protein